MGQEISIDNIGHVQIGGQAYYDEKNFFMFSPDLSVPDSVQRFRGRGIAQQMTDGTFDFVPEPRRRSQAVQIRKLAHGRASETKDNAILLTIKVFKNEGLNISETIKSEADEAVNAIRECQLKR